MPKFVKAGDATTISGPGSCTIIQQRCRSSLCVTDRVAAAVDDAVYVELYVRSGRTSDGDLCTSFGAVGPMATLDLNIYHDPGVKSYFMRLGDGSLYGSGKHNSHPQIGRAHV